MRGGAGASKPDCLVTLRSRPRIHLSGFQAFGAGVEMDMGLPLGFDLVGDLQYRMQSGYDPFPEQTDDLDVSSISGAVELSNSHYSLRGFTPYLSAG